MRWPVVFLGLVLGGCSLWQEAVSIAWEQVAPAAPTAQDDVLQPGDALRVTVVGEDELSGIFVVNSNGAVRMELLGAVPAAGLSPATLGERVRQRLAAGYLRDPQVRVQWILHQFAVSPPLLRQSQLQ